MNVKIEFRGLSESQLEVIMEMRENQQIICAVDGEWIEEMGSGYYIPTATYDIGWKVRSSKESANNES